jgi:hypothetical protein
MSVPSESIQAVNGRKSALEPPLEHSSISIQRLAVRVADAEFSVASSTCQGGGKPGHAGTNTSFKASAISGVFLQRDHVEAAGTACKRASTAFSRVLHKS